MKRKLDEQVSRMHKLAYGDKIILERSLWDIITGKKKDIDNKQADLVEPDVKAFFDNLHAAAKTGLSQRQAGQMDYQKEVETMQIGLELLGYELPQYGVDGKFGPETAATVEKFKKDNNILNETVKNNEFRLRLEMFEPKVINEMVAVVPDGGGIIGSPGNGTHDASDWQSRNAWDVTGPAGAKVLSITSGVIAKNRKGSNKIISSGGKKIFGDQVMVKSNDGKPDVFYTHISCNLTPGTPVKEGDVIGTIMQADDMDTHVHVGLSSGNLKDFSSGLKNGGGGGSTANVSGNNQNMVQATPNMLNKLIELLQNKKITAEDINKHTNVISGGDSNIEFNGTKDNDFYKAILTGLGAPVTPENLKFLYAWRQGEGHGGLYNPFNTTLKLGGSSTFDKDGVQIYKTPQDGLNATIKTINLPRYRCIADGLRKNIGASNIAACECLDTWGTTSALVSQVVAGYNAGHSPKIRTIMA